MSAREKLEFSLGFFPPAHSVIWPCRWRPIDSVTIHFLLKLLHHSVQTLDLEQGSRKNRSHAELLWLVLSLCCFLLCFILNVCMCFGLYMHS